MRGLCDDIDGFPLLRIVATKYRFRIDAKVFGLSVALCAGAVATKQRERQAVRDYSQGERLFNARSVLRTNCRP
jgi:hypothetical protein